MANTQKGEVDFVLDGRTFTFRLGTGALIELQEHVSKLEGAQAALEQIFLDAARGRVLAIRAVLWAGLRKHHPEVTLEGVEDLLDAASPDEIQALLGNLGATTVPDPADLRTLGVSAPAGDRPQTARGRRAGGTGVGSTSTPVASA